ncbi:PadR family transcriptional regulator [Nonomuraea sp. bgisy101]|uniref:PadR family transcriptional regulator n=1 Tax=Nonomuraea sp. bgisy101 TaxID=3413784 RepID=UPI003D739424
MADAVVRLTTPTKLVLRELLANPEQETYGRALMDATGLVPGTLYVILKRLEAHGWLTSRWEDAGAHAHGRPPRHYYRMTAVGVERAREVLDRMQLRDFRGRGASRP